MKIDTILVATDFSDAATKAVDTAVEFAKKFEAELVVLHAYRVDIPMASPMMSGSYALPQGFFEGIGQHARAEVEGLAKEVESRGVSAVGVAVEKTPAEAILKEAEARSVDLIIMGTRGLTGLKHVALGSVADRVIRMSPCPVLTIGDEH